MGRGARSVCCVSLHCALYGSDPTFFGPGPSPMPGFLHKLPELNQPGVVGLRKGPNWEGKHLGPILIGGDRKKLPLLDLGCLMSVLVFQKV
jgi:hypothetical protein